MEKWPESPLQFVFIPCTETHLLYEISHSSTFSVRLTIWITHHFDS